MTPQLFTPIQLGGITLPNRVVIAPMCQYSAQDGSATAITQWGSPMTEGGLMAMADGSVRLFVDNAATVLAPVQEAIGRVEGARLEISRFSLEKLFLQLTGKELRD